MGLLKKVSRVALMALSCALLAASIVLMAIILSLLATRVAVALNVAPIALLVTRALPGWLAFKGVLPSPLGGMFRTDFMLVAVALLAIAKICRMVAKKL